VWSNTAGYASHESLMEVDPLWYPWRVRFLPTDGAVSLFCDWTSCSCFFRSWDFGNWRVSTEWNCGNDFSLSLAFASCCCCCRPCCCCCNCCRPCCCDLIDRWPLFDRCGSTMILSSKCGVKSFEYCRNCCF